MQTKAGVGRLRVDFLDRGVTVVEGLDFGRRAELIIDDANRFMHRRTGAFIVDGDHWWLHNLARDHPMVLFGVNGHRCVLPAGTRAPLTSLRGVLAFQAGPCPYEISYAQERHDTDARFAHLSVGTRTAAFAPQLSSQQVEVLSEFARPGFQNLAAPTPTYAEVAQRLGLRVKTIDHLLNDLRNQLRAEGVTGIDSIEGLTTHVIAEGRLNTRGLIRGR